MQRTALLIWAFPLLIACGDDTSDKTTIMEPEPCGEGFARADDGNCYPLGDSTGGETGEEDWLGD